MERKPAHLAAGAGGWFKDERIAAAYPFRPAYPRDVFRTLAGLVRDSPRSVLDIGCGSGDLARRLAPSVDRVDAVDFSEAMLRQGRNSTGGDDPRLRWIQGAVEDAPLSPPYALVTAGESLHWMEWDVVLPRLAASLSPQGVLAIVERSWDDEELRARMLPIFTRYSPVRNYRAVNLVEELERRGLFTPLGERRCGPEPWRPTVEEFLEARHSQRGFSRTHMGEANVRAFDDALRTLLDDMVGAGTLEQRDGRLELQVESTVVWGKPRR